MDRKDKRKKISQALNKIVVPFLREQGFKGSMPHFRRLRSDRINLLSFQHNLHDAKFVVEIANCPPEGITTSWGEEIRPGKVTAHDMARRQRLGSEKYRTDYWFDYGKTSIFADIYTKKAKEVIQLWDEAEKWWEKDPFNQKNSKQ